MSSNRPGPVTSDAPDDQTLTQIKAVYSIGGSPNNMGFISKTMWIDDSDKDTIDPANWMTGYSDESMSKRVSINLNLALWVEEV